jgi:hypothetical protein
MFNLFKKKISRKEAKAISRKDSKEARTVKEASKKNAVRAEIQIL